MFVKYCLLFINYNI